MATVLMLYLIVPIHIGHPVCTYVLNFNYEKKNLFTVFFHGGNEQKYANRLFESQFFSVKHYYFIGT